VPYQAALAATFLEGLVFLLICITGLRAVIMRRIPRCILIAGACGIGLFIMFVGESGEQAHLAYTTCLLALAGPTMRGGGACWLG
jgi:AGZA family xanthine/uracil permease-like MFS transporter